MATTQAQLFTQFQSKMRDRTGRMFNSDATLGFANDALQQIESDGSWMWPSNVAANYSLPLTQGTQEYSLPASFARFETMVIGTNVLDPSREITFQDAVRLSVNASSATPSSFYIRGNSIGFYPIPLAATAVIYYRLAVTPIAIGDTTIPFTDDFVDAITDLMCANAYLTLVGGAYANEVARYSASYKKKLEQLMKRYLTRNPKGLNFKSQRRRDSGQRMDNVITY